MTGKRLHIIILLVLVAILSSVRGLTASAGEGMGKTKGFVDLQAEDLQIDSLLPLQYCSFGLPEGYQDSAYSVRLLYPEFRKLTRKEVHRYKSIVGSKSAPAEPVINIHVYTERKKATVAASFTPIVKRGRGLYFITSYMPALQSVAKADGVSRMMSIDGLGTAEENGNGEVAEPVASSYVGQSVLKEGRWAKIRVSSTGIYRLTEAVIRKAGFSDMSKVRIYGYGGNMVPERLTQEWIKEHDDLPEVSAYTLNGEKYFYARGSVSWESRTTMNRTRNPYSDYGYYFITEMEGEAKACTAEDLQKLVGESDDIYHFLYEKDTYAWAQTGRRLVDSKAIKAGATETYNVIVPKENTAASIKCSVTWDAASSFTVKAGNEKNDVKADGLSTYQVMKARDIRMNIDGDYLATCEKNADGDYIVPVTVACTSGGPLRLDNIAAAFAVPYEQKEVNARNCPAADYVYNITNQNHHADAPVDYVIIIPTTQKWHSQAKRLAELHVAQEKALGKDFTYRIVPADELYNEFSSGTPDVSAYRRYLKMYYDKAQTDGDMPKHVLLFGGCVWDNRMNTLQGYNPDDYLLIYETEDAGNVASTTSSTGIDDFITILKDGITVHPYSNTGDRNLQYDVAVGRIAVNNLADATIVVDKIERYMNSGASGQWTRNMVFIGDDDNSSGNRHMAAIDRNADNMISRKAGYDVKKIMLDAYERQSTSSGFRYPDVTEEIVKNQNEGALVVNYGGHASPNQLSHEFVISLNDVKNFKGKNYSLWFTAACETMPFDQTGDNLGCAAVLNPNGGAVGFIGTLRTVVASANEYLDLAFMDNLIPEDGWAETVPVGEALRRAKNQIVRNGLDLSSNKHQYALFGDPALRLAVPAHRAVIDSVDGQQVDENDDDFIAQSNQVITLKGHIEDAGGKLLNDYSGAVNAKVKDALEIVVTRNNDEMSRIRYTDRLNTLYSGTGSVKDGEFTITFRVPMGLVDNGLEGQVMLYADNGSEAARGEFNSILFSGEIEAKNDGKGPEIYAYLNTPAFTNGSTVGKTPFFMAEISDKDGLDVTGNSVGHNLELVVDGSASMTYNLNGKFTYDEGSYTSGTVFYVLPQLSQGKHTLRFRAWDLVGNMSTREMTFTVSPEKNPVIKDIFVSPNPVSGQTTFYLYHDLQGSEALIYIDIIDTAGRLVQTNQWNQALGVSDGRTELPWNASRLPNGLYLYRVRVSCNGSDYSTKTKKLIIAQ